jgi:hypothetical protein
MSTEVLSVALPFAGVTLGVIGTYLSGKLKTRGDISVKLLDVLVAERDRAEKAADRADARAKRWESFAWTLYRLLQRAGIDGIPDWPTEEQPKVIV